LVWGQGGIPQPTYQHKNTGHQTSTLTVLS